MIGMGERRLIEITTEICKANEPLWIIGYVSSLTPSDLYLLFKYLQSSTYSGLNVYTALYNFSCDYLKSKGIVLEESNIDLSFNGFSNSKEELELQRDYFHNMLAFDDSMKTLTK